MTFDPYFVKDGDKLYHIRDWHNVRQLTFPDTILSSESVDVTEVSIIVPSLIVKN